MGNKMKKLICALLASAMLVGSVGVVGFADEDTNAETVVTTSAEATEKPADAEATEAPASAEATEAPAGAEATEAPAVTEAPVATVAPTTSGSSINVKIATVIMTRHFHYVVHLVLSQVMKMVV